MSKRFCENRINMKNIIVCFSIILLSSAGINAQHWNELGNTGITPATKFLGTIDNTPIPFRTFNRERMRLYNNVATVITPGGAPGNTYTNNQLGFLGLGVDVNFFSGTAAKGPYSLLHLNGNNVFGPQQTGNRSWMRYGLTFTHNNDLMYVGPRALPEGSDLTRAVIAWSDNDDGFYGPDDFSFLFIDADTSASGDLEGREVMRLTGTGNVGVGNFQSNGLDEQPTHRLDVNGTARLRLMDSLLFPVDSSHVVITGLMQDTIGDYKLEYITFDDLSSTLNDCDWAISPIGHVVTGNFGLPGNWAAGSCNQERNVGIGTVNPEKAKLEVVVGDFGLIDPVVDTGVEVTNSKDMATSYGVYSRCNGTGPSTVNNFGGWFRGANSPNTNIGLWATADNNSVSPAPLRNVGLYARTDLSGTTDNWAIVSEGDALMIGGTGLWSTSDEGLKRDVEEIGLGLDVIQLLNPKRYFYSTEEHPRLSLGEGVQYGFLAQEVQDILPDLVKQTSVMDLLDDDGNVMHEGESFLAMNYSMLIPILTQGIKEQQGQIEELNARLEEMEARLADFELGKSNEPNMFSTENLRSDYELYQNRPNPFSDRTEIIWRMAEEAQATIMVQDQRGAQVSVLMDGTSAKGLHSLEWDASGLPAGTYFYSLEVNGQLMVKRAVKLER
jgi:hypothetical protein